MGSKTNEIINGANERKTSCLSHDLILEIDSQGIIIRKITPLGKTFFPFDRIVPGVNIKKVLPGGAALFDYHFQKLKQTNQVQHFKLTLNILENTRIFEARLNPNIGNKIILSILDISEKNPSDSLVEDLFIEKENLNVTLRSIADGIITTDINGRIVFMNKAAEEITGWMFEEAKGKKLSAVYRTSNNDESSIGMGFDFWEHAFLYTKDGRKKVITENGASIRDQNGNTTGVVVTFRDITEKWRMEQEIERTQRLEFIGNLAGGIAHDFNNILSVILANIQLVKMLHDKGKDLTKYINGMEDAVNRASSLTKQLLTFAKGGAPIKRNILLGDLLMETVELVLKGTNLTCLFSIQDNLWPVEIDPGQINQVFNNLTNNAVRTVSGPGTLEVSACNITITDQDILPLSKGKYIQITIKDNGPGNTKEQLARIFDPYYLLGQEEGNGLGLAVSYSIIKRHNGFIDVKSAPGAGTTFIIYLPAADEKKIKPKSLPIPDQKGKKILFMDDDAHITKLISEMLIEMDYRVETAKDGSEALELFKKAQQQNDPFDVIIMDLTVPGGMGGGEAIVFLRRLDPDVKAIVSSGYCNDPVMADFKKYGFDGMVSKPYTIEELCQEINRVLSFS